MTARLALKRSVQGLALAAAFPFALLSSFGKVRPVHELFAHLFALAPGFIGSLLRSAFYKLTLQDCSIDTVIGFGTYFSRRQVIVRPNVSVGSFCVIGSAQIGERTQVASHVEIPGKHAHARDEHGRLSDALDPAGEFVTIGADCWIGASVVLLADVGDQSTVGAGSVVVKKIPPRVVAAGNPARVIKSSVAPREPAEAA